MIQGSQKSILFQFPNDIDVSLYQFSFEVRTKLMNNSVLEFSTEGGSMKISGQTVLLFIPASYTRELCGEYEARLGFYIEPDDLTLLPIIELIIEPAILVQDTEPNGDSIFDIIAAQVVEIIINNPAIVTITIEDFGLIVGPGKSAYQVAVDYGFVGTAEQWLESLIGGVGEDGQNGEKGDKGDDGQNGKSSLELYREEKGLPTATLDEMMAFYSGRKTIAIVNKQDGNTITHGLGGHIVTRFFDENYEIDERVYTTYDTDNTVTFKTRFLEDVFGVTFNGFLLCERI